MRRPSFFSRAYKQIDNLKYVLKKIAYACLILMKLYYSFNLPFKLRFWILHSSSILIGESNYLTEKNIL